MAHFESRKPEQELRTFVAQHLEKPSACRDMATLRFSISMLCKKIQEMKVAGHVPVLAYELLDQYNAAQNRLLRAEFTKSYC